MGLFRAHQSVHELREAVHQLTLRVKRAEDSLALLEGAHERLRGRFYTLKQFPIDDPKPPKSKEEILREFNAARAKGV